MVITWAILGCLRRETRRRKALDEGVTLVPPAKRENQYSWSCAVIPPTPTCQGHVLDTQPDRWGVVLLRSPHPCDKTLCWPWGLQVCGDHNGQLDKVLPWACTATWACGEQLGGHVWSLGVGAHHTCKACVSTSVCQTPSGKPQGKGTQSQHEQP